MPYIGVCRRIVDNKPIVRLGKTDCTKSAWISNRQVRCIAPAGLGHDLDLRVSVAGRTGTIARSMVALDGADVLQMMELSFDLLAIDKSAVSYSAAKLESVEPTNGSGVGQLITLTGDNLGPEPSKIQVWVGPTECVKSKWLSNTQARCALPRGTTGKYSILDWHDSKTYCLVA